MKAISLLQPWATLVVIGAKKFETRTWQTFHRGKILIHASQGLAIGNDVAKLQPFKKYVDSRGGFLKLPFGAIIGEVMIEEMIATEAIRDKLSTEEQTFGDYKTGRWAWRLAKPVLYREPIMCKGSLMLWEVPEWILNKLKTPT
jgi:hypothetical protein